MNDKDYKNIETIIEYCNRIQQHVNRFDNDKNIFMQDILYRDACALVIIQIGEFATRLSDDFRQEYDKINWQQLIGLRNITAHNYESIIDDLVWEIIQEDIPEIKSYLESIIV